MTETLPDLEKTMLEWAREAARIRPLRFHNQQAHGIVALEAGRLDEAQTALEAARAAAGGRSPNRRVGNASGSRWPPQH